MSKTNVQFFVSLVVAIVLVITGWYVYDRYAQEYFGMMWDVGESTIYIESLPVQVGVADDPDERQQGLSDRAPLSDLEGLLFIFDNSGYHGIWMKDMRFAIDIVWINEAGTIVHIEEDVRPETYPTVFRPPQPARFVLETNAYFVDSNNIAVGDQVTVPPVLLPEELQ